MRSFWLLLTILFIVIGFIVPITWIFAIITAIIAIGSSPAERRADGKKKTGGLLGPLWDNFMLSQKMFECPYCKSLIFKDVEKCKYCGEWLEK